jgi:hypothetical protein
MLNTKLGALLQHSDIRRRRWAALTIYGQSPTVTTDRE